MTTAQVARIVPLGVEAARELRLPWSSPFDARSLASHVRAHPGRSFWLPHTGEYLIGEPWRHRAAVTTVIDSVVREYGTALVDALCDPRNGIGHDLVVMTDFVGARPESSYTSIGLERLQEVICYELRMVPPDPPRGTLAFQRIDIASADDLADLLAVDHAAFPWLWWNTEEEFAAYASVPGVELHVGYDRTRVPIAYVGITHFRGWGHLDRIGVLPDRQGGGYGVEALRFAAQHLVRAGADRIGLSTQADNIRSQRLYHRYGFRRTYQNDYLIYGRWVRGKVLSTEY